MTERAWDGQRLDAPQKPLYEQAQRKRSEQRPTQNYARRSSTAVGHNAIPIRLLRVPASSRAASSLDKGEQRCSTGSDSPSIRVEPMTSPVMSHDPGAEAIRPLNKHDRQFPWSDEIKNQMPGNGSTTISRTIEDIENLLKEALNLAQEKAEECESGDSDLAGVTPELAGYVLGKDSTTLATNMKSPSSQEAPRKVLPERESQSVDAILPQNQCQEGSNKVINPHNQSRTGAQSSATDLRTITQDWAQLALRHRTQQPDRLRKVQPSASVSTSNGDRDTRPPARKIRSRSSQECVPRPKETSGRDLKISRPEITPRSASKRSRWPRPNESDTISALGIKTTANHDEEASTDHGKSGPASDPQAGDHFQEMFRLQSSHGSSCHSIAEKNSNHINLDGRRHVDIKGLHRFDVHDTSRHQPIARDWTISRKRFAASIACTNTALIGIIIGIYAGEVPAIQYVLADLGHRMILGNVFFYLGLAIPTLCLWPLPLMHGRKPYMVMALAVALCLQIPQGIAVSEYRSDRSVHRHLLLASRAVSGFVLGFVNINLQATLLDLFGASLQSSNPYEEIVDPFDVRRHGGGMGLWLGLWSLCSIGSISLGFFIGTLVVYNGDVSWGFWTSLLLIIAILLLNVIGPEVRRSAYRRTVAEVMGEEGNVHRVSRGEIKMHLKSVGPYWWGEEVKAGMALCWKMVQQPGFAVTAMYAGWVYAHFTLVLMLLGALTSRYYRLGPIPVGLCVLSLGVGALLAMPFQKASLFSRARRHRQRTDSMTLQGSLSWSSHLLRRAIFTLLLPFAGLGYAVASRGPSISVAVPTFFAAGVGFLSNLAIAECQGIVMEAYDTSDLQPGMTGRPNRRAADREREQRTNFSCYPRISAGLAVNQGLSFIFASIATGVCGRVERRLGTMQATGIVVGVLLGLTLLLTVVLVRFRVVRMIPDALPTREYIARSHTLWEPVVLGQPSGTMRKISILESGKLTRWSEIRLKNRLTAPND